MRYAYGHLERCLQRNHHNMSMPVKLTKTTRDEIIELRLQGVTWPVIAKELGVSERVCRRTYADWSKTDLSLDNIPDPLGWYMEQLAMLEAQYEDLGEIVFDADSPGVKLKAIDQQLRVMDQSLKLRVEAGFFPPQFILIEKARKLERTMRVILEVFERYDVPRAAVAEIRAELMSLTGSEEGTQP